MIPNRLSFRGGAALALLVLFTAPPSAAAGEPSTYAVQMLGNPAGEMTVTADGATRVVHFAFNDRGRGPDLTSTVTLSPEGVPMRVATTGVEYFKGPVDESLAIEGGRATWASRSDRGEAAAAPGAFYLSMDGTPAELGWLAAALRSRADRELPLLPAGVARLTETGVATASPQGTLALVEITGLGFTPESLWLDERGDLAAIASDWMTVVRSGLEGSVGTLLELQKVRETARSRALAAELARRPEGGVAFVHARVFDAEAGVARAGMTVLVEGERIAAVGSDGSVAIPAGAEIVDASGGTLLPGLWDMHTHLSDLDGLLNIAAGVTTARDLANDTESLLRRKAAWDAGEAVGPRVVLAGFMDGPGPYAGPTKVLVDTEEEVREAIDRYADTGHEQIKIYSSIDPALVPAIAARTHERGLRLSGHVPAFMTAEQAVRAGFDEIQHVNMLLLNFWPEVGDTRTPARFSEPAARAASLDLDSAEAQAFLTLLRDRDIVIDPTVSIFEEMFTGRPGTVSPPLAAVADRLPATVRRGLFTGGLPVPEGMDATYRASFAKMLELVRRLHERGIRLVAGTDALAGFSLHRELQLYAQAGIPAADVLRIATLGSARVTGREADLGSVTPGKLADLALVDGDPLADLGALSRIVVTMKGGALYDTAAVYRAIGVAPPP